MQVNEEAGIGAQIFYFYPYVVSQEYSVGCFCSLNCSGIEECADIKIV